MPSCKDCGKQIDRRATRCLSCAAKNLWKNPEYRRKQSEDMKARWEHGDMDRVFDNPETRRKRSESAKAAWKRGDYGNPETHRKMSEGAKMRWARGDYEGVLDNPETRCKLSEGTKAAWERGDFGNPEWHRKRSESMKEVWARGDYDGVFNDPEIRRKISETLKARWQDPEYRQNHSGENSPHWQGGVSFKPYGRGWTEELRRGIRERDNHTCAISGEVWQEGQDRFAVHHINYDKADNRPENLITLSHSCHSKTNTNRCHWQSLLTHIAKGAEMCANAFVKGI